MNGQRDLSRDVSILYSAEVRAYRNDLQNLIEFYLAGTTESRNIYSYRNLARAYTQGIETNVTLAVGISNFGALSIGGGYQFLDAKDVEVLDAIDAGTAGTIDKPLTREDYRGLWNRSRHSGVIRLQYDSQDRLWSANLRFQFVGKYGDESLDQNGFVISDPPRREFVDGYTVINTAITRSFELTGGESFTVGAGVNNILDVFHPTLIPGLVGRQFFIQGVVRF